MAHELGHLRYHERHPNLAALDYTTRGIVHHPVYSNFTQLPFYIVGREAGRNAARATTAAHMPALANEAYATLHGAKALYHSHGLGTAAKSLASNIPAFASYATAAAMPMAIDRASGDALAASGAKLKKVVAEHTKKYLADKLPGVANMFRRVR